MLHPSNIVITGASSGLGAALAGAYAKPGVTLGLTGRNAPRLSAVASLCTGKGAAVETGIIDVRDREGMNRWLAAFNGAHPIDLLVANAGISVPPEEAGESEQGVRDVLDVNVGGVLNSVLPVIPLMRKRKSGQIAVTSSLAGIRGMPSYPAYSASKVAVRAFGEALRGSLKPNGIEVSVICPGFIRTPMTDNNAFPMPLIMSAEKAADIIIKGLERNKPRIAFPLALYLPLLLLSFLPLRLTDPFFAALPKKTANGEKR
jgi:short-subunit dehydrogenase